MSLNSEKDLSEDRHNYGMVNGHDPSAANVICIDWDGTLFPWGPLYSYAPPNPGAVEAMKALKAAGYELVILTSRLSPTWQDNADIDSDDQLKYMEGLLSKYNIPWDRLTSEKVAAIAYIDDRAIEYKGNWQEVLERVIKKGAS